MSESKNITNAISAFSEKLRRCNSANIKEREKNPSTTSYLQEEILQREERFKKNIISTYKIYKSPFESLGKNSERAKGIDKDEQSLLASYKLYEQVMELNEKSEDALDSQRTTFISKIEISSPLAQKAIYTDGGMLVYLLSWLYFENGCTKFMPYFKEEGKTKLLCFEKEALYNFDSHDREIFNIIKQEFYS